ncbi:MAG: arabinosyltransferase domain-containing protein, partial [Pseudonocardia sp.]|nr:arabinosyltransferase domain-containing protein [Pseudonocardia sp.]
MLTLDRPPLRRGGSGAPPRGRAAVAAVLGALSAVLAIAFPWRPVQQDPLERRWPTVETGTAPGPAPLVAVRPERLAADVPCAAITDLGSGLVLSTTPPDAPGGAAVGLAVAVSDGVMTLTAGGEVLAEGPVPATPGCTLAIDSDVSTTTATLGGRVLVNSAEDLRPQVVGVYSDLDGTRDAVDGTSVRITVDNRYDTEASVLKIVVGVLAVLALLGCLVAVHGLDRRHGRRLVRVRPRRATRRGVDPVRDVVVLVTMVVWLLIGAVTADDGYILTMVRTAEDTGYVGNYYRWFDVPEAPFGWFYELYAPWAAVSDSPAWLRLPSLAMGVASWLLLSRGLLPRLGRQVRQSRAAGWAAATVFLCFWLPFGSGLRPEPVVVLASLITYVALERALVVRRLLPVALGLTAAAFAVAATPTGLLAVAPFLAAGRPLLVLFRARAQTHGWAAVVAPVLGSGLIVLVAVFGDQPIAAVLEATRVRTEIGPNVPWFNELVRYVDLFAASQDGSLARRFPVLLLLLCIGVCSAVILRRGGIPGAALGPSRRLIAVTLLGFVVLALTPTKWTHHFGVFAAVGGGVGALAALATSAAVLRSGRNRAVFAAAVLGVAALAFTGPNAWMYVSNWGVPWFDRAPVIGGVEGWEVLLFAAASCLAVAGVAHLRGPAEPVVAPPERANGLRGRALRLGSAPLVVICGAMVLFQVASMAKGVHAQRASYSLGGDVLSRAGLGCGLSDHVLVERDPRSGVLSPAAPRPSDEPPLAEGFAVGAVPPPGGSTGASDDDYVLRNGLGTGPAPAVGSYRPEGGTGEFRSTWFALPAGVDVPLTVAVAGATPAATTVSVEFGRVGPAGTEVLAETPLGDVAGGEPGWRDLRTDVPPGADVVRLLAEDRAVAPMGWIALTPPRVPALAPLTEAVGDEPTLVDWPVGFANPCVRPFAVVDGVAEVPTYRLLADEQLRGLGDAWSAASAGGPLAWRDLVGREGPVPAYLDGEPERDWGELR